MYIGTYASLPARRPRKRPAPSERDQRMLVEKQVRYQEKVRQVQEAVRTGRPFAVWFEEGERAPRLPYEIADPGFIPPRD